MPKVFLQIFFMMFLIAGCNITIVKASHIPGANITYSCNPSNPLEYTFTLTVFRRCPGTHPTSMSALDFTLTNDCGLANPIVPTFNQVGQEVDVNQLCASATSNCSGGTDPGVWMYTYEATIVLPANCDGWHIDYNLCCRDASSNLTGTSANDMHTSTSLNTLMAPCNNSPVVTSAPIPYACTNSPFSYCLTTQDIEGDSLYFRMVAPQGNGGLAIGHLPGFSPTAPLTNFTLDPLTGCFTLNEPNVGNYVVAIQIEEYDNFGNLISTIIHDFQVQVVSCTNSPPSNPVGGVSNVTGSGSLSSSNSISACVGQSFCFDVTFEDAIDVTDNLSIQTDGTTLFPGATFTQTGNNPVTGTFCWTVVPGNTGNVVTFIVQDDGCPVMGTSGFGVNIDIITGVYAGPDASVCGSVPVQLNAIGGASFTWAPATGLSCTNCPNPVANPAVSTLYTVTSNLSGSCSNTDQVLVNVESVPPTATITGNLGICNTASNTLTASGGTFYLWSTGETTSSINVSPAVTTDYHVTVTNFLNGCEAYDTVAVTVAAAPIPAINDITICNGGSTTITAGGGGTYMWSTGATTSDITVSPVLTTAYYVTVTLGTCVASDTAIVTVTPTSAPVIVCPNDTTVAACNSVVNFTPPVALDYCAAIPCQSSPINDVLTALNTNGSSIAGNIPNGFNFTDGVTGTNIPDGGSDMYDGGNQLNTNLSTLIPYTGGSISNHPGFGGGAYFTHKFNNLFVMVADLNGVNMFEITGNNGADGSGTYNGFTYTVSIGCLDYDVFVKRVNGAGDPSINHVFIIPSGSSATHSFATTTDNDLHTLTNLTGVDRLYYMLFSGAGGYAYTDAEIQAAVLDFLTQANTTGGGVAQAAVVQTAGLPSGSAFPTGTNTVTFQATGVGGISTCSFDIIVTATAGPVLSCRADTTVPECSPIVDFVLPPVTDPCGGCDNATLIDLLADLNTNGTTIASGIPNGFNFSDGLTGTNISDGGSDMYDGGNFLNTNLSASVPYTGGAISTNVGFGSGSYFTHKFNNLWIMAADLNGITTFNTSGNNGADGGGSITAFDYTVTVGCKTYYIFVKQIHGAGDPSINHVFIVPDNGTTPAPTHTWSTNTNDDAHTLNNLAGFDRLYYLLFAGTSGYNYTNAQVQQVVLDFLNLSNAGSGTAINVTQITGLPSGSTFPVGTNTITFSAINNAGQTDTCSFDIIVTPGLGPLISCRTDTIVSECNSVVSFNTPSASDPCNPSCAMSDINTILTNLNTNGVSIASNIPSGHTILDGISGTCISDGGGDMYDCGNQLNTNVSTLIPYTGGTINSHAGFGGASYFTHKFNNLWVMTADLNGVNTFETTGNNGADGSGIANGFNYTVTVGCMSYYVFVKRINGTTDPSINHIFIVPDNGTSPAPSHTFSTNTNDDLHTLSNLGNFDRLFYLLLAGTGGYAYSNTQIQTAVVDFLTQVNATTGASGSGLTVTQVAGLPSGSVFPLGANTVTFRATSLTSGLTADCSFDVVVQPKPSATITGASSVCTGSSLALNGGGGNTYLWNTGATTASLNVSPIVTTPYYLTVTDALNCSDSTSTNISVDFASTDPTIIAMPGTYCPNTTLTLAASGGTNGTGASIEWYDGPNGTGTWLGSGSSVNINPTSNGQTFYARREGSCNITGDDAVNILLKDYVYALNAATTNTYCTDNSGWHHFFDGDQIYLSIQGDVSGAIGGPQITIWDNGSYYQQTQGPLSPASCANGYTSGEERFEMERSWNVDFGGGTLNPPYNVRFYYEPSERTTIETAAAAHMASYSACGYNYKYATPQGFYWFKNISSNYSAPDYDGLHITGSSNTTSNGINYDQINGLVSFSGGSGAIILVPNTLLPVQWLSFEGETDHKTNHLTWTTAAEQNTEYFNVQRSKDGVNFTTIGIVNAHGSSSTNIHYSFDDQSPFQGENYYRLELVDIDGAIDFSDIILLMVSKDDKGYSFYPNPTNGLIYYQYESYSSDLLKVEVLDVLGKQLKLVEQTGEIGLNKVSVDLSSYPSGTYMIRIHNTNASTVHTAKVVKNKL